MTDPKLIEELDAQGFVVVRGVLDRATTAAIRTLTDVLAPPIAPRDTPKVPRVHVLRHPLDAAILPRLATYPRLLELAMATLRAPHPRELRMLEQVLIRTDPGPGPYGATGWHIDQCFHPDQYNSRPRRTYYHMVHAASTTRPGGGCFSIVPGSHHKTYAGTVSLTEKSQLKDFQNDVVNRAGIDVSQGIEVPAEEGDIIIFNPMCLHSASGNRLDTPRYVYFASFMHRSAIFMRDWLADAKYGPVFSDAFRAGLPEDLRIILDREDMG